MSALGSSDTYRAMVTNDGTAVGFAALDAGLVTIDASRSRAAEPRFVRVGEKTDADAMSLAEIEATWGERLRSGMGIRRVAPGQRAEHILTDVAAPLPHDLDAPGLRRLAGLTMSDLRHSPRADMLGLFDDDVRLGPSLQSLLFLYGGLGALAALPAPLARLVPEPHRFLIAAGCAFAGNDSFSRLRLGMQPRHETVPDKSSDKLAYRLAASLNTHGPALIAALLAPALGLSLVRRRPDVLARLVRSPSLVRHVPQAPLVTSAACASALFAFCYAAPQLIMSLPGHVGPEVLLWTAADAGLEPDARILEGFGGGALMSTRKLAEINAGRPAEAQRAIAECLAPFDVDAQGTVVGNAGSGVVVTTLDFALRNFLDVTSIVVGWGQSGETGGKAHFAGVGFGGENAVIRALEMAYAGHGVGVADFEYYVAHATGTRTNSRSDLTSMQAARRAAAARQGYGERLPPMSVGAPKAVGDGHSMGETGLKAVSEGIHYLLGEPAVGIPTLRTIDGELAAVAEDFVLAAKPCVGHPPRGALVYTQGFGGFNAAVGLRAAHPDTLRAYSTDPTLLDAYLERWSDVRQERIEREARDRRRRGFVLRIAEEHCWPGITT
jgi:3-oxoacyl-(acyl-carrier-protein) synthase